MSGPEKLEWAILKYPRWSRFLYGDIGVARVIYPPIILLPDELYERVMARGESDADAWAVIVHERAHLSRIKATAPFIGPIIFGIRFLLADKTYMLQEELFAIHKEMQYRRTRGVPYDIERKARQFSSRLYRHLLPYDEAKRTLLELWKSTAATDLIHL